MDKVEQRAFDVLGVSLAGAIQQLTLRALAEEVARLMADGETSAPDDMYEDIYREISAALVMQAIGAMDISPEEWSEVDKMFAEQNMRLDIAAAAREIEHDESQVC